MSELFQAGDILLIDLDPIVGTEQAGVRPALVISNRLMHEVSRRVVVCPITQNLTPWPTKVILPPSCSTRGMVLADQVRSIDVGRRMLRRIEAAPMELVWTVRSFVGRLLDLEIPDH
jgi:mRNA interferase MazF